MYCTKLQIRVNPLLKFTGHLKLVSKNICLRKEPNGQDLMRSPYHFEKSYTNQKWRSCGHGVGSSRIFPQKHSQTGEVIHAQSYNDFATFSQKMILQANYFYYGNVFLDELQGYFENPAWCNVYINKLIMMGRKGVANDNSLLML